MKEIQNVLVIGAGAMGHGIAQLYAQSGFEITLMDLDPKVIDQALVLIKSSLDTLKGQGLITDREIEATLGRIRTCNDMEVPAKEADLVVEAVPEDIGIKQEVFDTLDKFCRPDTLFATNTSGLDVFAIMRKARAPYVAATHFFAPAQIIPLVEVCPGPDTLPEVLGTIRGLMKKIGKQAIVLKAFVPSFIVNRIQNYIAMAVFEMLSHKWATAEEIDTAVKLTLGIRLPVVGVVQTMDFTGLDLVNDIAKSKGAMLPIIDDMVKQGHLGAKTSKGFYDYGDKTEAQIVRERDKRYLEMAAALTSTNQFRPVQ